MSVVVIVQVRFYVPLYTDG